MVHVVSMEDVTMRFGDGAFQEKDVRGAGGDTELFACASAHFSRSTYRGAAGCSCC